jgi:hypothetical protein
LPPDQFWRVTPRVFTAILEGRRQARVERAAADISLAWHVEAFRRSGKRMPSLEKALSHLTAGRTIAELPEQTPEDMVEVLRAIDGGKGLMKFEFIPHPSEGAA